MSITPLTWNVIGLDSNDVTVGPEDFPVGARICNNTGATITGYTASLIWDSSNAYINSRPGTNTSISVGSLANNACIDVYFEVQIDRNSAAYNTSRRYHIQVTNGTTTYSSTTPRELFVEHLVSQSRNSVSDVQLNGHSIPAGGTMTLVVGETYNIKLIGSTSTNGYEQLESFINFPNTIFQINSVTSTYGANGGTDPNAGSKPYADGCGWVNDPTSPNYRTCTGTGKYGGNITVEYNVTIISGAGTSETLNTLIYDFSGSSYHYNSDFSASGRIASIVSLGISKSFAPAAIVPGGTSTLTFTINNPTLDPIDQIHFTDSLPLLSGGQMTVSGPIATSGCGSPSASTSADNITISIGTTTGATIAANSTCTITVQVTVPSTPTSGTYPNQSADLFIDTWDTGSYATANLNITNANAPIPQCGQTLATWTMETSAGTTVPPLYTTKASAVATATASFNAGATGGTQSIDTGDGNPVNSWLGSGFQKDVTPNQTTAPYFQFDIDTSHYTSVEITLDTYASANWGSSNVLYVWSSANGGAFTATTPATGTLLKTAWSPNQTFAAATTGSSTTTFRINASGANPSGAGMNLDNIRITGCYVPNPPTITKSFATSPIAVGQSTTLTFRVTNPNTSTTLNGIQFTDTLPAGLTVTSGSSSTCGGTLTRTSPSTISFSGGTLAAGAFCDIAVTVTATTSGVHNNVSGYVSSTEGGTNTTSTGYTTASLTVLDPPTIEKVFDPNPILTGGISTLTFVLTNPNNVALTGVKFSDTLPGGGNVKVASSPNASTTCSGSPTWGPLANTTTLTFGNPTGGTIPANGTCTVRVDVTGSAASTGYVNTSGAVQAVIGGVAAGTDTASDTLVVDAPHPSISLLKQISTSSSGPWSSFLTLDPSAPGSGTVYYKFTIENTGDVPFTLASASTIISDPTVSTAGCTWYNPQPSPNPPAALVFPNAMLPVASATQDPTAYCIVSASTSLGDHPNTATAAGTYSSTTYTSSPSSAEYVGVTGSPGLSLIKQVGTSDSGPWSTDISGLISGTGQVYYRFTLVNTGAVELKTISVTDNSAVPGDAVDPSGCAFTDPLAAGNATSCTVGPFTAQNGTHTDIASASAINSVSGATVNALDASASYTASATLPNLTVAKTDDTSQAGSVGAAFHWTLTVSNAAGAGTASFADAQTIVSDPLPANATYGTVSQVVTGLSDLPSRSHVACAIASGTLSCTASGGSVLIAGGESFTASVVVTPTAGGSLSNTATVDPVNVVSESDETAASNTSTDTVAVSAGNPNLGLSKDDGTATVLPNGTTTYTLTVGNTGGSDSSGSIVIVDVLPTGLTVLPGAQTLGGANAANWTCNASISMVITCTSTAAIAATSGTSVISFPVSVGSSASGTLTNKAQVGGGGDPTTSTPSETTAATCTGTDTPIQGCAVDSDTVLLPPTVTKSFGAAAIASGGNTSLTVTIGNTNASAITLTSALTDTFPGGLTINTGNTGTCLGVTATAGAGSFTIASGTSIPSGGCTVILSVTGSTAGAASNTIAAGALRTSAGNNASDASDTVNVYAPPTVTKTFTPSLIVAGGISSMQIIVTNPAANPGNLTGVSLDDIYTGTLVNNAAGSLVCSGSGSATLTSGANGGTSVGFTGGTIEPGGTCTITQSVTATTDNTNTTTAPAATGPVSLTGSAASATLTVGKASPTIATQLKLASNGSNLVNPVLAGTALYDTAALTGGYDPGGTITYKIYSDNICATLVQDVAPSPNTVASGVVPNSANYTFNAVGNFWYQAVYSGDVNNNGATSVCTDEPVVVVAIDARDDTGTTIDSATGGTSIADVLADNGSGADLLNGVAATTSTVTISAVGSWPSGISLNAATGAVTVAAGTTPGAYTPQYQICDQANPTICDTATVTVTVVGIDAKDDTGATIDSATGGTSIADVLADNGNGSDLLNGVAATTSTVTISAVGSWPSGITLNTATGSVSVAAGTTPGTYTPQYKICDQANPTICDTATATVTVVSIDAKDDTGTTINGAVGGTSIANVLADNGNGVDLLSGVAATTGTVTITAVGTWPTGVSLNTSTGAVSVAAGTAAGTYTPQYQICDQANPTVCDTAMVTVVVVGIDAKDDAGTTIDSSTGGTSIANVLADNGSGADLLNGAAATTGTVTISLVGSWPSGITLNTATGAVTVASGTTPGTYTPQYQICDQANPSICDTATVTVTVAGIDAVDDSGSAVDGVTGGQSLADVLANDSLNGVSPVSLADVNLTQVSTTNAGVTLDTSTGAVNVAAGTSAGTYTVTYQICDKVNPGVCDTATVSVTVYRNADLSITKDDGSTSYSPGGTTTYTVTVKNNGTSAVTGAVVTDSKPSQITSWTWACAAATCDGVANSTSDFSDTVDLPDGATIVYTVTAQIDAAATGDLDNIASVALPTGSSVTDPDPNNNSSEDIDSTGSLSVTKSLTAANFVNPTTIDMTYTITVANTGSLDLGSVQVTDDLSAAFPTPATFTLTGGGVSTSCPSNFTVNASYNGATDTNLLVHDPATSTLASGASCNITLVVEVNTGGTGQNYTNTATATGIPAGGQEVRASDSASGPDFIDPAVSKSADPSQAAIGETVTFTIDVTNNGTVPATGVVVTDTLPDNFTYGSATSVDLNTSPLQPRGTVSLTPPRTVVVDIGDLGVTDKIRITIITTVNALGTPPIQNTASVTADPPEEGIAADPLDNNTSSAPVVITETPGGAGGGGGHGGGGSGNGALRLALARLPSTGFAPAVTTVLPPRPLSEAYQDQNNLRLEIPRLHVNMPVTGIPFANNTWDVTWLSDQAGWLQGTAFPSWSGNSVLTGHVYLANGLPGPFVDLHTLAWGDRIIIHYGGERYVYEVRGSKVISPDDASTVFEHKTDPWLTLLTCRDYNAAANTYSHRVAVQAVLIKVEEDASTQTNKR